MHGTPPNILSLLPIIRFYQLKSFIFIGGGGRGLLCIRCGVVDHTQPLPGRKRHSHRQCHHDAQPGA